MCSAAYGINRERNFCHQSLLCCVAVHCQYNILDGQGTVLYRVCELNRE